MRRISASGARAAAVSLIDSGSPEWENLNLNQKQERGSPTYTTKAALREPKRYRHAVQFIPGVTIENKIWRKSMILKYLRFPDTAQTAHVDESINIFDFLKVANGPAV